MKVTIKKSSPIGTLYAPPSKSYTHRYLIASMLSDNESVISNVYFSDDVVYLDSNGVKSKKNKGTTNQNCRRLVGFL